MALNLEGEQSRTEDKCQQTKVLSLTGHLIRPINSNGQSMTGVYRFVYLGRVVAPDCGPEPI